MLALAIDSFYGSSSMIDFDKDGILSIHDDMVLGGQGPSSNFSTNNSGGGVYFGGSFYDGDEYPGNGGTCGGGYDVELYKKSILLSRVCVRCLGCWCLYGAVTEAFPRRTTRSGVTTYQIYYGIVIITQDVDAFAGNGLSFGSCVNGVVQHR